MFVQLNHSFPLHFESVTSNCIHGGKRNSGKILDLEGVLQII